MEAFFLVENNLDLYPTISSDTSEISPISSISSRKGHKKSRLGCHNCKIRKVKCDETKPECRRCEIYGVRCAYDQKVALKRRLSGDETSPPSPFLRDVSVNSIAITLIHDQLSRKSQGRLSAASPDLLFDASSFDTLRFFQHNTMRTLAQNDDAHSLFRDNVVRMATSHPYLMYTVLTMTMVHQRWLQKEQARPSVKELMHYQEACSSFSKALSTRTTATPENSDAVFLTSTMLAGILFISVDTNAPEKSWPLTSREDDLLWLEGRRGVVAILNSYPFPQDGVVLKMARQINFPIEDHVLHKEGIHGIPASYVRMCKLDEHSNCRNSPYMTAIRLLLPMVLVQPSRETAIHFIIFLTYMDKAFVELLKQKDVAALIILLHWYTMVSQIDEWWPFRRSSIERVSICMYLDRELGLDDWRRGMLEYPAKLFHYTLRRKPVAQDGTKAESEDTIKPILAPQSCTPM